jgi:S-adenosylmethionine-dependent methyltransferase
LKKAIINKDPEGALISIENDKEYSGIIQTEITTYEFEQIVKWLSESGYEILERYGIHNVYGYVADNDIKHDDDWHNKMIKLELQLGHISPYREIAIFTHIVARKIICIISGHLLLKYLLE